MANLFSAEHLAKNYGVKPLFADLTLHMDAGDRIGLIGINGTGKSTLLKIIAGAEQPDDGHIAYSNDLTISYLPQNPEIDPDLTVMEQILNGLTTDPELEMEAAKMLTKLGIMDFNQRMNQLSGGQKKRVMLAGALMHPANLLILDEPTNHLDTEAVDWIEQQLKRSRTSLLMITHDRYFLDHVTNRIIELDQGKLYSYDGNYSVFLEKKAERLDLEAAVERKRQSLLRTELAWIRRGAKARSTKQKARIDRFESLSSEKPQGPSGEVEIALAGSRLGKKVIELQAVGKSFGGRTLIKDFSTIIQRNDRIGVIGPNGSGKSTLLNMIAGLLTPDQGLIETGQTVKIGYFSQESKDIDESLRVIEYIKEGAEQIRTADGSLISAGQMLERFLFPSELQWSLVGKLSGGEKRRLYLLRILMESPNVLLLDEPTNDLDIQTLTILEEYLEHFPGAVIAVSHDRFFLDRMTETILAFEGDGVILHHVGNYSDYRQFAAQREQSAHSPTGQSDKLIRSDEDQKESKKNRALKFSYKEQQEFAQIDDWVAEAEQALDALNQEIDQAGSDYEKLRELTAKQQEAKSKLEQLLERWTYLNELAEQMERQKHGQ